MNRICCILILMLISCCIGAKLIAAESSMQIEDFKKNDIKKLILLDGQKELTKLASNEIFNSIKTKSIQIPQQVWDEITHDIEQGDFLESLIPIYDKYLTHEDIKEILNSIPLSDSQKNKFSQKKLKIDVIWGHKLAMKIQQKLWDKNINFDIYDELDDYDASPSE